MTGRAREGRLGPAPGGSPPRAGPAGPPVLRSVGLAAVAALAAVLLSGCGEDVVRPEPGRPVVLLVLNQTARVDSAPVQPAFVLRQTGSLEPAYAAAESFELRRVEDGARFAWRAVARSGRVEFDRRGGLPYSEANFLLPSDPEGGGLGLGGIEPGRRYTLRVETEGATVRGTAAVPGEIDARRIGRGDGVAVAWPRVEAAGGYVVATSDFSVDAALGLRGVTSDTSVFLPDSVLRSPFVSDDTLHVFVSALDGNLAAYRRDSTLARSGLDRGLGVFGGVTTDSLAVAVPEEGS